MKESQAKKVQIAIINLGSQYTLLIHRLLGELGVYSVVLFPDEAMDWLAHNQPKAIILSGGPASVNDADAPQLSPEILSLRLANGDPLPILGICYGMQWIAYQLGGQVLSLSDHREYGKAAIAIDRRRSLFHGIDDQRQIVWASHGDTVFELPQGFQRIATSENGAIEGMSNDDDSLIGVQFHPEVIHTKQGKKILSNFVFTIAGCQQDYEIAPLVKTIMQRVLAQLGRGKALLGLSGGVDSTTLARILSMALGDRLICVVIDGGQLREGELGQIYQHATAAGVKLIVINARARFLEALKGITDAGEKRKRFKEVYAGILRAVGREYGATAIIQGTLAPDRIESGVTGGSVIKEHHNVGNDMGNMIQIHPIDNLFKYEVRLLAQNLGLPESVWGRQPFPGPGLFIRVFGTPVTAYLLDVVRWADARVKEILKKHEIYDQCSQVVTAYAGINTVGIKGDQRVYAGSIIIHAVQTVDFMTSDGIDFPKPIKEDIERVLSQHPAIVRVWHDSMNKPPSTTEME